MPIEVYKTTIYISYHQFFVYDELFRYEVGFDWPERHFNQGFARRPASAAFGALVLFGDADVVVYLGQFSNARRYDRAISVPFHTPSGYVILDAPERHDPERIFHISPGHYKLTAAQKIVGHGEDDEEDISAVDFYLEMLEEPLQASEIIIADEELKNAILPLIEHVDLACLG